MQKMETINIEMDIERLCIIMVLYTTGVNMVDRKTEDSKFCWPKIISPVVQITESESPS